MDADKLNPAGAPITSCDETGRCELVACSTCLAEIPADVAKSFEGPDYVQYFCGLECLERWQKSAEA